MMTSLLSTDMNFLAQSSSVALFAALLLLVVLVISPVSGAARERAN